MTLVSANNEWTSISSQIELSSSASEIANWFLETQGDVIRSSGIQGSIFGARDVVAGLALNASKGSQLIESYVAPQVLANETAMRWSLVYRGGDRLIVKDSFVDIERHPTNDGFSRSIGIGTAAFRDPAELGWSQGWLWRERDFHPVPAWLDWK